MNLLSIDPGIEFGWAFWKENSLQKTGVIKPFRNGDFFERADNAIEVFDAAVLVKLNFDEVLIEWPNFREDDTGQTAARSGALLKLMYMVGRIAEASSRYIDGPVKFVPVVVWKGQLPKQVVWRRCQQALGLTATKDIKSHAQDAVGIGLWSQGKFE